MNKSTPIEIDEIIENFEFFDEWDDRYRYIIDLGKKIPPLDENDRVEENKIKGCQSQVWMKFSNQSNQISFTADSDSFIVKGLIAILLAVFSGKTPNEIQNIDHMAIFQQLSLDRHLSPTRSNGLYSMVNKITNIAKAGL